MTTAVSKSLSVCTDVSFVVVAEFLGVPMDVELSLCSQLGISEKDEPKPVIDDIGRLKVVSLALFNPLETSEKELRFVPFSDNTLINSNPARSRKLTGFGCSRFTILTIWMHAGLFVAVGGDFLSSFQKRSRFET